MAMSSAVEKFLESIPPYILNFRVKLPKILRLHYCLEIHAINLALFSNVSMLSFYHPQAKW